MTQRVRTLQIFHNSCDYDWPYLPHHNEVQGASLFQNDKRSSLATRSKKQAFQHQELQLMSLKVDSLETSQPQQMNDDLLVNHIS